MTSLTVLYDATCPLCCRAARWLADQDQLVPLRFLAAGSPAARELVPDLDHASTRGEVTVVADDGAVYRGERAWLICLWALRKYRRKAAQFSKPGRQAAARMFVLWVSRHRQQIGRVFA